MNTNVDQPQQEWSLLRPHVIWKDCILILFLWQVQEQKIEYTQCKNTDGKQCDKFFDNVTNTGKTCFCTVKFNLSEEFKGPVFMYYGLSNFYQVSHY